MSNENIYILFENLGLEKQDVDNFLSYKELNQNLENNQNISSELYKAGSRYGTIAISYF